APSDPWIVRARRQDVWALEEKLEAPLFVGYGPTVSKDQEINAALGQLAAQQRGRAGHDVKRDAPVTPREPIDDGRDEACSERIGAADPRLAGRRVAEILNILDALPELFEGDDAAVHERAPIGRGLDPLRKAIEQRDADRVLEVRNCLRDDLHRNSELMGRLAHAACLRHGLEHVQVPQLDAASDPVCPLHVRPLSQMDEGYTKNRDSI